MGRDNETPPATMHEVADHANVSVASVSRVLSGTRPVTRDVEARVRAAASELGYRVNRTAQSLRRKETGVVGMIVPQITNPFFPVLVDAVERALYETHGLELMLSHSRDDPQRETARLSALLSGRVDGIIVIPVHESASRATLEHAATVMPVVQVDRWVAGADLDVVTTDHAAAMGLAIDHLVQIGRSRLAYLGAGRSEATARTRHAAAHEAARAHGLELATVMEGSYTVEFGARSATALLATGARPDAIVCSNDLIAFGVVRKLLADGIRVPDQVAVTGIDGVGIADMSEPRLTTVVQPVADIARTAVEMLVQRLSGTNLEPRRRLLAPELRIGGSTVSGPSPQGGPR